MLQSSFDGRCAVIFDGSKAAAFEPAAMRLHRIHVSQLLDAHKRIPLVSPSVSPPPLTILGDDGPTLTWAEGTASRPAIGRLTVNVSNNCNLWCSYCYADHGFYGSPKSLMPVDTARAIATHAARQFGDIKTVQFFGGEPLQNPAAIEVIASSLTVAGQSGVLSHPPEFVATTNGTIQNEKILQLLHRFKIDLTISLDGPAEIHDAERPLVSGRGSHRLILQNIQRFRDEGIAVEFECTYSACHLRRGLSVVGVLDYFERELGQRALHVAPASGATGAPGIPDLSELLDPFEEAVTYSLANIKKRRGPVLGFVMGIMEQLSKGTPSVSYCPAFFDQVSISVTGDVFPCFMFIGDGRFHMGNLLSDGIPNDKSRRVMANYRTAFGNNPSGTQEWYAPLHFGCIAGDYRRGNQLSDRAYEALQKRIIERTLLELAHIDESTQQLYEPGRDAAVAR